MNSDLMSARVTGGSEVPKLPVGAFFAMATGQPLSDEQRAELDRFERERAAAAARRRELLGLVDLAHEMEHGSQEPPMLTGNLVRGEHHTVFGARESGKTWLVLADALEVMSRGGAVVWVDKEMGRRGLAARLASLGAAPEAARRSFVYLEHPSMDTSAVSRAAWQELLDIVEPALMVVDAHTEVLADAGLQENSGTDIEQWSQAYVTPARRRGVATVMIDHVGHSEGGRPVASRQKGAAAKVELLVEKLGAFDRETTGQLKVEVTKNTFSASIEKTRYFEIGPANGGEGQVRIEQVEKVAALSAATSDIAARIRTDIVRTLEDHGPMSASGLADRVTGSKRRILDAARELAAEEGSPVLCDKHGRGHRYSLAE